MKRCFDAMLLCVLTSPVFAQSIDVPAYLTDSPPAIDGVISPGEWDAAGPATFVTADDPARGFDPGAIEDDEFSGDQDLSFSYRVMWEEPWTAYLLIEVNDDIAMDEDPANVWERDQVELFFDGDDQFGSDDTVSFQWWQADSTEIFGKFGVSRYNTYEGNAGQVTDDQDALFADDEFSFLSAAAVAAETNDAANYFVEYAINLEPMDLVGAFEDDEVTEAAGQLVQDHTVVKFQIAISDDDNFSNGTTERSHTLSLQGLIDWRATDEFPNLVFTGPYTGGTAGDFDGDGDLDAADIDALSAAVGGNDLAFDLTGDGAVDEQDRTTWIRDLKKTWVGDANLDGLFDSSDFVSVFGIGEYEDAEAGNSGWSDGDWNGDFDFNSSDFVAAFSDGGYEVGVRGATAAVPEPSSVCLLLLGALATLCGRRRTMV